MRLEPHPSQQTPLCKIKRVPHAPSAPCPLRGGSTRSTLPAPCHDRTPAKGRGVVSRRFARNVVHLEIRLQNELSPRAWKCVWAAADGAGLNVEAMRYRCVWAR
jgi:hypothetical protein